MKKSSGNTDVKSYSRNRCHVSDQQKTRNSILQVFQSRLKSPGTVVVSLSAGKTCDDGYSGPSMSDSESVRKPVCKTRKRRKRSERNRQKSKWTSKNQTSNKQDVNQHVKKAHDVTGREMEVTHEERASSCITNNRITTKLGMFNKAKQSNIVARGPLKIPESVREKTREDLRKILNINEGNDKEHQQLYSCDKENFIASMDRTDTPIYKSEQIRHRCLSGPSHHGRKTSLSGISSCSSSPSVPIEEEFPESPPLEAIAKALLLDLKPSRWFPGTGYVGVLEEELGKIMKQNAPGQRNLTPMKSTPGSVKSETVKRSLLRSLLSADQSMGSEAVQETVMKSLVAANTSQHRSEESTQTPTQPVNTNTTFTTDIPDVNKYFDARSLLSHNDSIIAARLSSAAESDTRHSSNAVSDHGHQGSRVEVQSDSMLYSTDIMYCSSQDVLSPTSRSASSFYTHSSLPASCHSHVKQSCLSVAASEPSGLEIFDTKQAVVTKINDKLEYMPRFHGDYFIDHLERWTATSSDHIPMQDDTLDILEVVDQGLKADVTMRCISPDSDGSPLHFPDKLIIPLKPSIHTPSPPEKLYPRRLY